MSDTPDSEIRWLPAPEEHDYPAAASYLSLIFPDDIVVDTIGNLRAAMMNSFKAKDLFRASRLPLLGVDNKHVHHDQRKILSGETLSPLLLVRDSANTQVIIADGYHRLCAVYSIDEDAQIPCKIVSLPQ